MIKSLRIIFLLLVIIPNYTCGYEKEKYNSVINITNAGDSIRSRFDVPEGFTRIPTEKNSFKEYLQSFKLKPKGTTAKNYDGSIKEPQDVYEAVMDIDVGNRDLQQCADAIMRLRAEYLFGQQKYGEISFNFTNGFRAEYSKWKNGYRIKVNGNKAAWIKKYDFSESYQDFREYLDIVFTYAGTLSLSKELAHADISDLQIGDIFIRGGSPGHAVIVVDMAVNENTGEKLFMLAQSYMPAQDIQILKNPGDNKISPWYSNKIEGDLITPEWIFKKSELKRF
ncbi:MAG: DUF4846 domain-containing protein [Ignavibacteria bacterium]|nr:DUF4846 domain-containing protein [Ignavibacteria bacterium]